MKCKHCGEEIASDSVFCEFCGTKVKKQIIWWQMILGLVGLAVGVIITGSWLPVGIAIIVIIIMKAIAYKKEKKTDK